MHIKELALNNYRNYREAQVEFSEGINILYGDNAQGKTNIIEAIYMLATTKSHRGNPDKEIIRFDAEEGHIRAEIRKNAIDHRIDMHLRRSKNKGIAVDLVPIRRSAELLGLLNIIIFSPEDMTIIKNGPAERRRFMDMELCQLSKLYYSNLSTYNKVLNQRNNLLRQIYYDKTKKDMLSVWNLQLVKYGAAVIAERERFIGEMNEIVCKIHKNLTNKNEELRLVLKKNVSEEEDFFLEELRQREESDIRYQSTQCGPHRDDIEFYVNEMNVRKYGSQGQQRTVALSLKLAEIELVKKKVMEHPILLLDDVMSELDEGRREALLDSIREVQTIITCTGYDDFVKERLPINRIYRVVQGSIHVENAVI